MSKVRGSGGSHMYSRFVSLLRNTELGHFLFLWYVVSKLAFWEEIQFGYLVVFDKGSPEQWPYLKSGQGLHSQRIQEK